MLSRSHFDDQLECPGRILVIGDGQEETYYEQTERNEHDHRIKSRCTASRELLPDCRSTIEMVTLPNTPARLGVALGLALNGLIRSHGRIDDGLESLAGGDVQSVATPTENVDCRQRRLPSSANGAGVSRSQQQFAVLHYPRGLVIQPRLVTVPGERAGRPEAPRPRWWPG